MKLVTSSQMRSLDASAVKKFKIPSLELMEKAGAGVADAILKRFPKKGLVAVVVGKGNNGGDGLVAARRLKKSGFNVEIYLTSSWQDFSPDARVNWDKLAGLDIKVHEAGESFKNLKDAICIVDAIFGTGLATEVAGRYKKIIETINSLMKYVVAVDVPSGLSSDTGAPLGAAVKARLVVTLGLPKVGLFTSAKYVKEVEVADIGIPKELTDKLDTGFYLSTPELFKEYLTPRPANSHKGDFGHVLVIGGSLGKMGAGLLSARGALRSGAGLVTYALPKSAYSKFDTRSPEIMYEALPDGGKGYLTKDSLKPLKEALKGKSVCVIGPGIGTEKETKDIVMDIVSKTSIPIIIDADALNCLSQTKACPERRRGGWHPEIRMPDFSRENIILTPHPGEMARLVGKTSAEIQNDRIGTASTFAKIHSINLVLKGFRSICAEPNGTIYINPTGSPAMATAGSGDVLSGVIAGLIAQGFSLAKAVVAGTYIHGMAGDMSAEELGERGVIAGDIIANLPKVLKILSWSWGQV